MSKKISSLLLKAVVAGFCLVGFVACEDDKPMYDKPITAPEPNFVPDCLKVPEADCNKSAIKLVSVDAKGVKVDAGWATCHWAVSPKAPSERSKGGCYRSVKQCGDINQDNDLDKERCAAPGIASGGNCKDTALWGITCEAVKK